MERLVLALALAAIVVAVAVVLQRRQPAAPGAVPIDHQPPAHLVRPDFERPDAPWLVVVFTSASCSTCADVWTKAELLESDAVAVQQVEVGAAPELHRRYGIGAVPIVAIADDRGEVRKAFMGPVSSTHLWAALADLRDPGSVPPGCGGHDH